MITFENYFSSIFKYVEELRKKNRQVRKLSLPSDLDSLNRFLIENYNPAFTSGIVLKSETFLELGNPSRGSCAMTIYTNNTNMLKDGEITLIGPDVGEATATGLPFGQVIMAAGENLDNYDYHALCRHANVPDLIEGYMIKSTLENIWSRISYDAAENGFNFLMLGAAITSRIKVELPKVTSLNILFVTSNQEDIIALRHIGSEVREIYQKIKEKIWDERGVNILECSRYGHCGQCEDRAVCETITKLTRKHRKNI